MPTDKWSGGANGYIGESGEWERSSGYTYELSLFRSLENNLNKWFFYRPDDYVFVVAKLSIWRDWKKKRGYWWTLSSSVNQRCLFVEIANGSTTSVESCKRQALTALCEIDAVFAALKGYYSQGRSTTISTMDGVEIMSVFDFASGAISFVEPGEYIVSGAAGNWHLNKSGSITCMRGREVAA